MKSFDTGLEVLIIKYSLGTMFIVVTLIFGVKILMLCAYAFKAKLASLLATLDGGTWDFVYEGLKKLWERGAVK